MKSLIKRATYGIHKKIFFFYSVSSLVLIIALSLTIHSVVKKYMHERMNYYVGTVAQQINNNLDYYIDEMKNTLMAASFSDGLREMINGDYLSETEKYEEFKSFNNSINSIISPRKRYNDLFVIIPGKKYIFSSNIYNTIDNYDVTLVESTSWYKKMMSSKEAMVVLDNFTLPTRMKEKVGFAIALKVMPKGNSYGGYMVITIYKSYFDNLLKNIGDSLIDFFVITDEEVNILYSTRDRFENVQANEVSRDVEKILLNKKPGNVVKYLYENYFFNVNYSRNTNWKVIFFSSENKFNLGIKKINLMILLITVLISLFMLSLSYYIASGVTNPVKKLMKLMKEVENNNLGVRADISNNDEIGELNGSFNNMVNRINILVNEILEGQILRREAEIYALQQQINPHFLYNTLEAINSLANRERYKEIRIVVQKMAEIFQYCINRKRHEFVRISDELKHVENYMAIQEIRFKDRIKISYDIDNEIYDMWTIKFILQPLVENAIHHGIEELGREGCIKIRGYVTNGAIYFEIEDNGKGMSGEELETLNNYIWEKSAETEKERSSIGLRNVNSRISLMFKGDYGVRLKSIKGKGMNVTVKIPVINEKGEFPNAEDTGS